MTVDVTVAIATINNRSIIHDCLQSLYAYPTRATFEVFVIDDASTDGTADMIRTTFPQVHLLVNDYRKGLAANLNQALKRRRGRYSLLLNDDITFHLGTLDSMVDFMDAHIHVGAIGPRLIYPNGKIQASVSNLPTLRVIFFRILLHFFPSIMMLQKQLGWLFELFDQRFGTYDGVRRVENVLLASMMVRDEVIQQIGFLDEQFFIYGEEIDYSRRIGQAGWPMFYVPHTVITHYAHQSVQREPARMTAMYYISTLKYTRKHFTHWRFEIYRDLLLSGFIIRWINDVVHMALQPHKRATYREWLQAYAQVIHTGLHPARMKMDARDSMDAGEEDT